MMRVHSPCRLAAVSPRRRLGPPQLLLVFIAILLLCTTGHLGSCGYDYAVQPHSINFTTIPQSQTVVQGETVVFNCSFPIVKLGSNYPVPHLEWWKNGTRIRDPEKPTKEEIGRGFLVSQLVIDNVTAGDEGYYECIAVDGKKKGEKAHHLRGGRHVFSTPRAHVQVISLADFETHAAVGLGSRLEQYGIETVTLDYGEPYVVPCDLGRPGIARHVLWYQNGTLSNRNTVLSNGSLLLPAATPEDDGLFQCSLQIGDTTVDSQTQLLIQVSEDPYQGDPHLYTDTSPTVPLLPGATLHIHFYILGAPPTATPLKVEVRKDGERQFSVSPDIVNAPFKEVCVFKTGVYECILRRDGNVISAATVDVVQGYVSESEDIYEVTDTGNRFRLKCGVLGGEPYQLVYWYRNGRPIPAEGDSYNLVGDSRELDGSVYQCFVVTSTGMINQSTWRVFNIRFSNPPTDVRCSVRFKDVKRGYYYPVVTVTWGPPDFHAIPGYSEFRYEVYAEQGLNETRRTTRLFVDDIDLKGVDDYETGENVYAFSVRNLAKFDDEGDYSSAPARCDSFNTITRAINPPLPITLSCSSSYANFTWQNPLALSGVPLSFLKIQVICIYSNHTPYEFDISYDEADFFNYDEDAVSGALVYYDMVLKTADPDLAMERDDNNIIPIGAVCRASGRYQLDHGSIDDNTIIPPKSCAARPDEPQPEEQENVYLSLECRRGFINMTWITPPSIHAENISLHTSCLNTSDNKQLHKVFSVKNAEVVGEVSVKGDSFLLCSFYGEFIDSISGTTVGIPPVQCYKDESSPVSNMAPPVISSGQPPVDPTTQPNTAPPTTPPPTVTSVPSSQTTNMSVTNNTNYTIVLEVSIPTSVVIVVGIVLVVFIILFLRCRASSRYNAQRLNFSMEWDLDKNYQPCNPEEIGKTISMETVYDNGEDLGVNNGGVSPCYEEKAFKLDTGTPSESGTDPGSEGLKYNGGTPALSPVVVMETPMTTEDSGCGLRLDMSGDENGGKEHLFNRLLTGINDAEMQRTPAKTEHLEDLQTKLEIRTREEGSGVLEKSTVSSNIAQMVADRLHNTSDSTVPSSGYGTVDCYKFSTNTPEVTPEYLAQKLRDLEESESLHDDDLLNSGKYALPTNKTVVSKLDLTLSGIMNTDETTPNHLPSLLLTPPQFIGTAEEFEEQQTQATTTSSSTQLGLVTSSSTGNLSSSYIQDDEGYLHVSSATNSSQTHHHQSFDTLAKSL